MRDIILVFGVLAAALVGFRRPAFGMLTFAFLGFFNPHSFMWGFGRTFPLSQVVAISTILGHCFLPSEKNSPINEKPGFWFSCGGCLRCRLFLHFIQTKLIRG